MCLLVVEDQPDILALLERRLSKSGHEVVTASDASAAMQLVADHPCRFTGLITDFHMALGVTGGELIEHMRELYPRIPIVLSTGFPDVVTREWLTALRVELLPKPYSIKRLLQVIADSLSTVPTAP
jgi:DNA-binding NtrC family response regulator